MNQESQIMVRDIKKQFTFFNSKCLASTRVLSNPEGNCRWRSYAYLRVFGALAQFREMGTSHPNPGYVYAESAPKLHINISHSTSRVVSLKLKD